MILLKRSCWTCHVVTMIRPRDHGCRCSREYCDHAHDGVQETRKSFWRDWDDHVHEIMLIIVTWSRWSCWLARSFRSKYLDNHVHEIMLAFLMWRWNPRGHDHAQDQDHNHNIMVNNAYEIMFVTSTRSRWSSSRGHGDQAHGMIMIILVVTEKIMVSIVNKSSWSRSRPWR